MELIRKFKATLDNRVIDLTYKLEGKEWRLDTMEGLGQFNSFNASLIVSDIPWAINGSNESYIFNLCQVLYVCEIPVPPINQKIAMWCEAWKHYRGATYKVSKAEVGVLKNHEITVELLRDYFEIERWWNKDLKSISNYAKNINEIKASAAGGAKGAAAGGGQKTNTGTGAGSDADMAARLVRKRFEQGANDTGRG